MRTLGKNEKWVDFSCGVAAVEFDALNDLIARQVSFNGWFTNENVRKALLSLGNELSEEQLTDWTGKYRFIATPKRIALIMAGNIPLVGFHDFLCVLCAGHTAVCKLSSTDKTLLPALASHLKQFLPELSERIEFSHGKMGEMDGVIATGSDNSLTYFDQYFGKYPHIFRKNRTSIAVFDGSETSEQIKLFGDDLFAYFGLGCRNVSHFLVPESFEINRFFEGIVSYGELVNNNKYGNNYDYQRAIYLMNQVRLLDNNFVLLRETDELFSPLAMLHYHRYTEIQEVENFISKHADKIQVVIGNGHSEFGSSQRPSLHDYADGVDVMKWLEDI